MPMHILLTVPWTTEVIRIPAAEIPSSLVAFQQGQRAQAKATGDRSLTRYDLLSGETKAELRDALYEQQSGRCAYCERSIRASGTSTRIEHFHPRDHSSSYDWNSICEQRTGVKNARWDLIEISFGNLLLCCDGGSLRSCDVSKGSDHICEIFFSPKHVLDSALVSVLPNGYMIPKRVPGTIEAAQNVIDACLLLNSQFLVEDRRGIFSAELSRFSQRMRENPNRLSADKIRSEFASSLRGKALSSAFGSTLLSVADKIERDGKG